MIRLTLLLLLVLFAAAPCGAASKPNIILIFADDLGITDISCYGRLYGRTDQPTPHLDALAAQGAQFITAYCPQPICSPSRAALMTGKAPARLHLTNFLPGRPNANSQKLLHPPMRRGLPVSEVTLAELLKKEGYATGLVGKWHLGGMKAGPREQGFDFFHAGQANTTPSDTEGGKGEYGLTAKAIEFIEENRERPFFLYLPHNNPHVRIAAKPELVEKHRAAFNPINAAMMETLDDSIGLLLARLDALGLSENTIVIFTSDNGGLHVVESPNTPATHNAPFRAGKGYLYEGGLREPLIVRWPARIKPGMVIETQVLLGDLVPTLLEFAGAPVPQGLDYQSIAPLLRGETLGEPRPMFWHFPHYTNQGSRPAGAIREGEWKLIEHYEDGRTELFHLAQDVSEENDLSRKEPARVAAMRGKLAAWRTEVGAQENTPNPDFEPLKAKPSYIDIDTSALKPEATAAATAPKFMAWREAMNAAVRGRGREGNRSLPPAPETPAGFLILHARDATIAGEKLRYEADPRKETLGFWSNAADSASWDFAVKHAGDYRIEVLQGCGKGSGGAKVEIVHGRQTVGFQVEETGHFQNFVVREVGALSLQSGPQTLTVRAKSKPGAAVMDLRQITLTRVASAPAASISAGVRVPNTLLPAEGRLRDDASRIIMRGAFDSLSH